MVISIRYNRLKECVGRVASRAAGAEL